MAHQAGRHHAHPGHDHDHQREPESEHDGHPGHQHVHGVDPALLSIERGLWAIKWSVAGLAATAALQFLVVLATGSVALLADTIHNLSDAATAVPLGIAFLLGRRPPSRRFTYGYGRAEDLAGVVVVAMILLSAVLAAVESVNHMLRPEPLQHLWAVAGASLVGFAGNEAVARFRINVGREIGSAALVADGQHARSDALTSLAVLAGAAGVALGFPLADPVVGLVISALILRIVWETGGAVLGRLLDSVDQEVPDEVRAVAGETAGVLEVSEVRVRWLGHRLLAELNIAVEPQRSVVDAHAVASEVQHQLLHRAALSFQCRDPRGPGRGIGRGLPPPGSARPDEMGVHGH